MFISLSLARTTGMNTHFSHALGASSTYRSITMSPSELSSKTDIAMSSADSARSML